MSRTDSFIVCKEAEAAWSSAEIRDIVRRSQADYTLIYTHPKPLQLGLFALERFVAVADDSGAGLVYSDYYEWREGKRYPRPVIDYQQGSLRNDFHFGSVLLFRTEALRKAAEAADTDYRYAGLYDIRLKVSQQYPLVHINEYLYTAVKPDARKSDEKQFDYVDARNREVQMEMETACTNHLRQTGAYLPPQFKEIDLNGETFATEASVIIPVRNRVRTIRDALRSAASQQTSFAYNIILIDNHSTDGTTEAAASYPLKEESAALCRGIIRVIPERTDLGIGGCWNLGIHHPDCGKFAVQLDSDDVYSDKHALQKIVDAFYEQKCAMIAGTYQMTDFDMNPIPPGIIDHREWTPANGRNNALRINGLGAPRAFYTPVLRQINFPDTSYGEDYAIGLRISRDYQIGRIYEVLYLCRRWEDNSDAAPDTEKANRFDTYKDRIRTWELQARIKKAKG